MSLASFLFDYKRSFFTGTICWSPHPGYPQIHHSYPGSRRPHTDHWLSHISFVVSIDSNLLFNVLYQDGIEEIEDLDALCHYVVDYYVRKKEILLQPAINNPMFIACAWTSAEERCLFQLCPFAWIKISCARIWLCATRSRCWRQTEMLRNVYYVYRVFFPCRDRATRLLNNSPNS